MDETTAAMLLDLGRPEGSAKTEERDTEADDDDEIDPFVLAAGEAFDAMKRGDREGFLSAFRSAVEICSASDYAGE